MNARFVSAAGLSAAVLLSMFSSTALGQWTSDAMVNTVVADGAGTQGTPIVRAGADGGVWVMFWDSGVSAGLKPVIQRLNASGVRMFPGNGIVLSTTRTNTASFTVDMRVDTAGNAYACFDDLVSGATVQTVQKILPDGTLAWGASGVQMPLSTGALSSRVTPCADGTVVCAYNTNGSFSGGITLTRIAANGTLVPGESWSIVESPAKALAPSDMISGDNAGDVIFMWVRAESTNISTSRKGLKAQKFSSTHAALWGAGVARDVYTSNATPNRSLGQSYFPIMVADGTGGAVMAWYDGATGTTALSRNAWLQHVASDGTFHFAQDGISMSTIPAGTELRLSAAVAFDQAAGEYTVAYERSNTVQGLFGMSAQRISSEGIKLWGADGIELRPIAGNHKSFINTRPGPDHSTVICWLDYQAPNSPMLVSALRLDNTGTNVWGSTLGVCTALTTKGRLGLTNTVGSDMMVAVWSDDGSAPVANTDVHAQNINMDGTIGPAFHCYADFNNDGGIDGSDVAAFFQAWEAGDSSADVNADGGVDGSDVATFYGAWEAGGC